MSDTEITITKWRDGERCTIEVRNGERWLQMTGINLDELDIYREQMTEIVRQPQDEWIKI